VPRATAPLRKADVEDDEVWLMVECHLQSYVAVIGGQYRIAVVGESALEDFEYLAPILDDEYRGCWTLGDCHVENIMINSRASKARFANRLMLPRERPRATVTSAVRP
jgi:hypothetical protein